MGSQRIFFEQGGALDGDSGERGNDPGVDGGVISIKPLSDGERAVEATFNRPPENLRRRTEVLRSEGEDTKYRLDADLRFLIWSGNADGVGMGEPIPGITWNKTTGIFVVSDPLVIQPINTPASDVYETKDYDFDDGITTGGTISFLPLRPGKYAYNSANLIRIKWLEATPAELSGAVIPGSCDAVVSGDPDHILTITIRNDNLTPLSDIELALTAIEVGQLDPAGIDWSSSGDNATKAEYGDIPVDDRDYYLKGTADRELHYIPPAVFATFFAGNSLSDGDTLSIYFPALAEESGTDGRRQRIPSNSNTTVIDAELFLTTANAERIPYAIPLCKRIGDDLLWVDGTVIGGSQTGAPLAFGEHGITVDRIMAHITSGGHPDTQITTAVIAGSPESFAGGNVHDALSALYGHTNARTERATNETVSGAWIFKNPLTSSSRIAAENNVAFNDNPYVKTLLGGSSGYYSTPGSIMAGFTKRVESWALPWAAINTISLGGSLALRDIKSVFDSSGVKRVVIADNTNFRLYHLPAVGPGIAAFINLSGFFPAGTYRIDAVCTDYSYVYVLVHETGTNTRYVNALDLTGTLKAGWPVTGTALPGTGPSPYAEYVLTGNICVATMDTEYKYASKLAALNSGQVASSGQMVSIIDASDGSVTGSGDGDAGVLPATCYPHGGICSDGTYIYFTWDDTGGINGGLASVNIVLPGMGSGYAGINTGIANFNSFCLQFDGDGIWAFDVGGPPPGLTNIIWIYRLNDQTMDRKVGFGTESYQRYAVFDGLSMWMQSIEQDNNTIEVYKLPTAGNRPLGAGIQTVLNMTRLVASFTRIDDANKVLSSYMGRMCYDGDSVWMIMHNSASNDLSGIIRRLPSAAMR